LATAHTTGSSRLGLHAGDLLGVEGEVVAEHAGGLLGGDLGHGGDVVQDGGDVVDECEQGGSGQPRQLRWQRRAVVWRNTPPAGVWELQAVR
jgi:hypothetical protein